MNGGIAELTEIMDGSLRVSPGGIVDTVTAVSSDAKLWEQWGSENLREFELMTGDIGVPERVLALR